MMIAATYANAERTVIEIARGGVPAFVPVDSGNRDFQDLMASGIAITAYTPPPPSADDVRAEATRRMCAFVGARDVTHLQIVFANASREAIRLLRAKAERSWTAEETRRAAALEAADRAIEAIRAASNAMELEPPVDYADDAHWPKL